MAVRLPRDSNQALGLGQFAIRFLAEASPSQPVLGRTRLFHMDAFLCGASALAMGTNAPCLLRAEAFEYEDQEGAGVFGSPRKVKPEKAIVANCAAVREWDSNGTNFGFNPELGHTAGEFGHNDFYPVVIAACQQRGLPGRDALIGMVLLDEIRGRLAEVFSLKTYKVDHVVHGAIASAATYGALMGASAEQIESAIGMFVAHYIPWRAIRAGKQLSDSKGSSAAISSEAAVLSVRRAMAGFLGPRDIFRNPEALFRWFVKTPGDSPFDLVLEMEGDDFAVMGMHFKLGLYEHQSAGALQGLISLLASYPNLADPGRIEKIVIRAYEPAFGIIGDAAKRDPRTRQSADHSMVYIVATALRKAIERRASISGNEDSIWKMLMLEPADYSARAIFDETTRRLMGQIEFEHGGAEYDKRYPEGIPTSLLIRTVQGEEYDSGLVMFPAGHARSQTADLDALLRHKFDVLSRLAFDDEAARRDVTERLSRFELLEASEMAGLLDFELARREPIDDGAPQSLLSQA